MSEHDHQVALFQILELNERKHPDLRWIYAVPNGGKRHPAVARKMKAEGVKSGIADVHVPIPTSCAPGLYIEMKFGKNKLSDSQKDFKKFVLTKGFAYSLAYSVEDALNAIEEYLQIDLVR